MELKVQPHPHARDVAVYYKSKRVILKLEDVPPAKLEDVVYDFRIGGERVAQPGDAKELAAFVTWPTFHRWLDGMRAPSNTRRLTDVHVEAMLLRGKEIASAILTIAYKDEAGERQTMQVRLEQDRAHFILEFSSAGPSHAILLVPSLHGGGGWDLPSVELRHEDLYTMIPQATAAFVQASVPGLESVRSVLMVNAWMKRRHGIPETSLTGHYLYAAARSQRLYPLDAGERCIEPLQRTDDYWVVPAENAWSHVHSPASREALLLYMVGVRHPYILGGSPPY